MSLSKRLAILLAAGIVGLFAPQFGERSPVSGGISFVAPAEAIVGRPLTPVSVAGVARRTVRRCAVGIYHC